MNHCISVELVLLSMCMSSRAGKYWKISFITSKQTIPLPKNKNRILYAKTTPLWPVFLSMANEVPIFGHIGCVISPDSTFIRFVLKLA